MDLNLFFQSYNYPVYDYSEWINKCIHWKNKWIFETPNLSDEKGINPYFALKEFYFFQNPRKQINKRASIQR